MAPEADLFDAAGRPAGKHYAGPHWESLDGGCTGNTIGAKERVPYTADYVLFAVAS